MLITEQIAKDDFNDLKLLASELVGKNELDDALKVISCAANLAYHLNFTYADDELESLLSAIGDKFLVDSGFFPNDNRFVFYDAFGIDNRGLTEQYLTALNQWGVEYVYIIEGQVGDTSNIRKLIDSNENARIHSLTLTSDSIDDALKLSLFIKNFKPSKVFLHLAPWSSFAIAFWTALNNVERYLIDLTDHAFWLGKSCSDYFIGFRDYGLSVSKNYRGIESHKLLKNLYYPMVREGESFNGFPFDRDNKVVVFSGGALYKCYGDNFLFFDVLKEILNRFPEVVFLYVGNGNDREFNDFIVREKLQGRIYLERERKDINALFSNVDVYLNTFPLIGGLMSQYAVAHHVPLIGYTTEDIPCNFSESLFVSGSQQFSFTNIEEFFAVFEKIVKDVSYRKSLAFEGLLPSVDEFYVNFKSLVEKKALTRFDESIFGILEFNRFKDICFEAENKYIHKYGLIKFKWLGFIYFKYRPMSAFSSLVSLVLNFNRIKDFVFSYFRKQAG